MRIAVLALSLAVPLVAAADPEDDAYTALPRQAVALGLHGHGSRVDGHTEGGIGPVVEVAFGRGRWQYVAEAEIATSSRDDVAGNRLRAALGARWLARQFAPRSRAGVELLLLADVGGQRLAYHDGVRTVRPEVAVGAAVQGRIFRRPRLTFRLDLRAVFTPDRDDRMRESGASTGFQAGLTCGF